METWHPESNRNTDFVEAIEEGKIVKVTEQYAKLEGLPILRKPLPESSTSKKQSQEPERISFDDLRKPLKPNQVTTELVDNFHWHILKRRRYLGLTRKQLADSINESEPTLKIIENGVMPSKDFIIINKIQNVLKINIRKDKQDFTQSPRSLLKSESEPDKQQSSDASPTEEVSGDEIEIIDDED